MAFDRNDIFPEPARPPARMPSPDLSSGGSPSAVPPPHAMPTAASSASGPSATPLSSPPIPPRMRPGPPADGAFGERPLSGSIPINPADLGGGGPDIGPSSGYPRNYRNPWMEAGAEGMPPPGFGSMAMGAENLGGPAGPAGLRPALKKNVSFQAEARLSRTRSDEENRGEGEAGAASGARDIK